ncbi:hypothetical protein GGX14DRAFT_666831 [Mycena pura]|uniref:Uncharacterized protein n=1 Tax=Mycena pura TaxID=153505 RepID=A0AAD6Y3Y5_9AGAR|nr:hypothetical protein GGX14DRAFT_666831 [Mycena pura]
MSEILRSKSKIKLALPADSNYYNGTAQFVFNALFFSAHGLDEDANHTVSWVLEKSDVNGTTGLIDYAVFSTGATKSKADVRAIVGGVVGGVLGLLLIGVIFLFLRRRRRTAGDGTESHDAGPRARRLRANRIARFPLPVGSPTEPLPPASAMSVNSEPQTLLRYTRKPLEGHSDTCGGAIYMSSPGSIPRGSSGVGLAGSIISRNEVVEVEVVPVEVEVVPVEVERAVGRSGSELVEKGVPQRPLLPWMAMDEGNREAR